MRFSKYFFTFLALISLGLALSITIQPDALAQSSSQGVNGRNVSVAYFNGGRFETNGDGIWREYGNSGGTRYTFRETQRDEWSVYMRDDSRNGDLQIDVHRKMISAGWDGDPRSDLYPVTRFEAAQQSNSKEEVCFDLIQGKVAWNTAGNTSWSASNVQKLCAGTSNPNATRDCFTRGINSGAGWSAAIPACRSNTNSYRSTPRPTPPPPSKSNEDICYEMIQGKVAWDRAGNKRWSDTNVKKLCAGTSNPGATRDCFTRGINSGADWSAATNSCRSNTNSYRSTPRPAPRPVPQSSKDVVTLYEHCNYRGYSVSLPVGSYDLSSLRSRGIKNDDISSIRVGAGYKADIFRDAGYRGPSQQMTGNVSCLTTYNMNDVLSSIRISASSSTRPTPPRPVTPPPTPVNQSSSGITSGTTSCICTANACGSGAVGGNSGDIFANISSASARSKFTPNSNTGWTCAIPATKTGSGGVLGCYCKGYCGNGGVGADPRTLKLGVSQSSIDQRYGGGKKGNPTGWICGRIRN